MIRKELKHKNIKKGLIFFDLSKRNFPEKNCFFEIYYNGERLIDGTWKHSIKISEQSIKISTPGILQVRRFYKNNYFFADMIFDTLTEKNEIEPIIIDPEDINRFYKIPKGCEFEDLLKPIYKNGVQVYQSPKLIETREKCSKMLEKLHSSIKRLLNPHHYPAGLEKNLFDFKTSLIHKMKDKNNYSILKI